MRTEEDLRRPGSGEFDPAPANPKGRRGVDDLEGAPDVFEMKWQKDLFYTAFQCYRVPPVAAEEEGFRWSDCLEKILKKFKFIFF